MVPQVTHVVTDEILERGGLTLWNRLPCEFVEIVAGPWLLPDRNRSSLDYASEMQVEESPECDELGPRGRLILLRHHPCFLLVPQEYEIVRELGAHEALMVVGGGVDEVADDLLRRPLAWGRHFGCLRLR